MKAYRGSRSTAPLLLNMALDEGHHDLHSSTTISGVIKSMKSWSRHLRHMGRNQNTAFVGKSWRKGTIWKT
jgi:hypothetical protein